MRKKHSILSLIMAMSLILTLFVNVAADATFYENIVSLAEPDGSGRTGIDYSIPDIIIIGQVNGADDGSYYINLTEETLTLPSWYTTAAYSINGGTKWTSLGSKVFDSTAMAKLFTKDITLVITDKYNSKTKKPADDATVVRFGNIKERPKLPSYVVNYSIGADDSGMTTGTWLLTLKNGTKSIKEGIEVAVANSAGKAPDEYGYGNFYGKDDTSNGIEIKEFPIGGKAVKTSYYIRTGATYNSDGTYTAASNSKKITVEGQSKPSTYKVDKKKKTIQYSADTYILKDDGEMLKPELKKSKGTLDVSNYNGDVYLWGAADDKDPASAMQKTSVKDDGGKELSYTTETVTTLPNHLAPLQYTPFMEVEPYAEPVIIPVEEATATATEPIAPTEETTATAIEPVVAPAEETTSDTEAETGTGTGTEAITELATESETEPVISTEAGTESETEPVATTAKETETTVSAIEPTTKPSKATEPEPTTQPATQPAIQEETTVAPASTKMEISLPTTTIEVAPANGIVAAAGEIPVTGVTLNKPTLSLRKGNAETLTATVIPTDAANKTVTWTSSNDGIATVSQSGRVTAIEVGTAIITAKTTDGGFTATCIVTVTIPVTGVTLNNSTLSLEKGATSTLTATVNPPDATNKNVSWTSSNDGVATVDQTGKVTAVGGGTATITVKTEDVEKTATCAVTVTVSVTGVTLDKSTLFLKKGDTSTLTATVNPSDATNKTITWTSSNGTVASVENGVVTALKAGKATITVTTADGSKTASCEVEVYDITISHSDFQIGIGSSVPLTATVTDSNGTIHEEQTEVTWAINNSAVATITSSNGVGTVVGVKDGTANITASYIIIPNSGTPAVTITATCMVTVGNRAVTGVTLPGTVELTLNSPTSGQISLTPTILPSDASNKSVTWTSNNLNVATVSNGLVTAKSIGTATITVTTTDGGFTAECKVTVVAPKYAVTLYVEGGNGTLEANSVSTSSSGKLEIDEGGSVQFNAVPNKGYQVKRWILPGVNPEDWDLEPNFTVESGGVRRSWTLTVRRTVSVTVEFEVAPPKIENSPTLPSGEIRKFYEYKFLTDSNSIGNFTWFAEELAEDQIKIEQAKNSRLINGVPKDLNFSTNGVISGTIDKGNEGYYVFQVTVTNSNDQSKKETKIFYLHIAGVYVVDFVLNKADGFNYNGDLYIQVGDDTPIKYDTSSGGLQSIPNNVYEGKRVVFTVDKTSNPSYKVDWTETETNFGINDKVDNGKGYTVPSIKDDIYVVVTIKAPENYDVEFSASPSKGGIIIATANGTQFLDTSEPFTVQEGSKIEFVASPNSDYRVKEWKLYAKDDTGVYTLQSTIPGNLHPERYPIDSPGNHIKVEVIFEKIPDIIVTDIDMDISSNSVEVGVNGNATYTAKISPDAAAYTGVEWSFDETVKVPDGNGGMKTITGRKSYRGNETILVISKSDLPSEDTEIASLNHMSNFSNLNLGSSNIQILSGYDIEIASIDSTGKVKILSSAEGLEGMIIIITATSKSNSSISKNFEIKIIPYVPVTHIELNTNSTSIVVGIKEQLKETIYPSLASNKDVEWSSSNDAVATVDQSGLVTGVSVGQATIKVTTKDRVKAGETVIPYAECIVTVTAPTLTITPADNKDFGKVTEGYIRQSSHSIVISNVGTSTSANLTASLDGDAEGFVLNKTAIGTIRVGSSATFTVTPADGLGAGLYTATVVISGENMGDLTFDVKFEVLAPVPPMITTNLLSNGIEKEPYTDVLDAVGSPASTWEVSSGKLPSGLSLNKNTGVISGTPTSRGSTEFEVTAKNTEGSDTKMFSIDIEGIVAVTGVTLSEEKVSMLIGDIVTLAANVNPINATNKDVIWSSSNPTVATVNSNGAVTGIAAGTAKITVMTVDGSKTDTCDITVMATPVTGMTLNKNVTGLVIGKSETLVAMIEPPNAANKSVSWSSSNPAVATVNSNGIVTGVAVGTATITAKTVDGNYTDTCTVMVSAVDIPVTGVTLSTKSASVVAGSTINLSATISPSNATNQKIIWSSSNNAIATIDANGKVTGVSAGTTTIMVKTDDGGKSDSCIVTVTMPKVAVTSVSLNTTSTTIPVGGTAVLTPFISPSDASNQNVTWVSSNSNVVSVDANGKISGLSVGTSTITVRTSDGGKTATCSVTVSSTNVAVTGVTVNPASATIGVGATTDLTPIITPSDATNQNVMWSSSNNTIATVDATGEVKGIAAGTAVITVRTSDGSKTATCSVTVSAIPVSGVTLNKSSISVGIGASETLTATVSPSNAANKSITWSSSDTNIATVDSNGKVTGKAAGTASITVKTADGNKTATCSVTVSLISVTGVALKSTTTIAVGDTETLTPTVSPSGATNKNVTWSSSDASIVTVDTNGKITGVSIGTATIEVTTADGAKTATCNVTVAVAYNITLSQAKGGTATISHTKAAAGAKVTLSPSADNGYYLVGWKISPVDIAVSGNSFTMPASNITVVPIYHRIPLISEYISPIDIDTRNPSHTFRFREYEIADGSIGMSIPGSTLADLTQRNSKFIIEFETPYGTYRLPANIASIIPDLNDVLSKNNLKISDISFNIILTDKTKDKAFIDALSRDMPNSKMIGSAVDFTIEIVRYGDGKLGNVIGKAGDFVQQVERLIPLPQEIIEMPKYWGAYRYNETSKRFEFVPHTMRTIDGKLYVIIQSATNSIYTVAENPVTFSDVPATEWYVEYVSKAAAKRLVQGIGSGLYEPERDVTRAEFVQMMVTALQLPKATSGTKAYDDVTGDWYYDAVMRAKSAGLLNKFAGTSFNPNQSITREEIAVILAAVIRYRNFSVAGTPSSLLGVFGDYGNFNDNYAEDIELVYRAKIMQGIGGGLFDPKGTTTRAQAATVQVRVLEMLKFID